MGRALLRRLAILGTLAALGGAGCQLMLDVDRNASATVVEVEGGADGPASASDAASANDTFTASGDARGQDAPVVPADVTVSPDAPSNVVLDPTPMSTDCQLGPCMVGQKCCWKSGNDSTCIQDSLMCNGTGSFQAYCDDTPDCSGTDHCCLDLNSRRVTCADCTFFERPTVCRTDAECGASKCIDWDCPRGPPIRTCGRFGYDPTYCY